MAKVDLDESLCPPAGEFPYPVVDGPEESRYLTWVRNHSNYLMPRGFLDYLRAAAVLIRGILINFLVLLPLLLLGALFLGARHFDRLRNWPAPGAEDASPYVFTKWLLLLALIFYLLYPVVVRIFKVARQKPSIRQGGESSVKARDLYERMFGGAILIVGVVALIETVPLLIHWFHGLYTAEAGGGLRDTVAGWAAASSVGALSLAGKASSVVGRFKKQLMLAVVGILGLLLPILVVFYVVEHLVYAPTDYSERGWLILKIVVGFLAVSGIYSFIKGWKNVGFVQTRFILVIVLLVLAIGVGLFVAEDVARSVDVTELAENSSFFTRLLFPTWMFVAAVAVVLWLFSWLSVDVNLTSVNGFYRDRLASSYLVGRNMDDEVDIEEDINLVSICQYEDGGATAPYHLVNTALNLQASENIGIRDRNSDFFVFSKRFIGGRMTGYCRTDDLEAVFPQMDLATAMGISAAAAAPNMGKGTSAPLVAMMTLFNVRLGYWVPNPGKLARWVSELKRNRPADSKSEWTFEDVFRAELDEIEERRKNVDPFDGRPLAKNDKGEWRTEPTLAHGLVGLAFSGGGIRSATVNMGITQALHEQGVFDHADYMSTVSGGGYLGSSISTLMRTKRDEKEQAGAEPAKSHQLYTLPNRFRWRIPPRAFIKEMRSKLDETHDWVNLSDGGHIENLATIELLRRRCKYIITGDAEADPAMHFGGMATLIRFARIDLGIEIEIDLTPVHVPKQRGVKRRFGLSERHYAVGTIKYPGETELGYLLYFKSSVTGDEDEVVNEYRSRSATFPHETTADQFFDEGQFEAYRSLGEHMARTALSATSGPKDRYAKLEEWFTRLQGEPEVDSALASEEATPPSTG